MKRPREEMRHRVVDVPTLPVQKRLVHALANRRRHQILEGSKQQNRSGGDNCQFPPPDPGKARGGGVKDKPTTADIAATSDIQDTGGRGKSSTGEGNLKVMVAMSLSLSLGYYFLP